METSWVGCARPIAAIDCAGRQQNLQDGGALLSVAGSKLALAEKAGVRQSWNLDLREAHGTVDNKHRATLDGCAQAADAPAKARTSMRTNGVQQRWLDILIRDDDLPAMTRIYTESVSNDKRQNQATQRSINRGRKVLAMSAS